MTASRRPRIAAIGLASWDRLIAVDRYPAAGSFAIVTGASDQPGGTTANSAVALARLGAQVALVSLTGDDPEGDAVRSALAGEGVDLAWVGTRAGTPTDAATVIVSREPPDRTIYWHQGARLTRGDRIDIPAVFGHDLVLIDADDLPLRRFLVDLPAHTLPATRLLGTMTYLADAPGREALEIALGHDALVGNEREAMVLCGTRDLDGAIACFQQEMRYANLRACAISRAAAGATLITATERWDLPAFAVPVADPTGAGDAFAAGLAYGMALRWPWPETGRFANAVAALAVGALGAQAALPSLGDVATLLGVDPATLRA